MVFGLVLLGEAYDDFDSDFILVFVVTALVCLGINKDATFTIFRIQAAIVTSEFINDPLTYNMTCGGKGSFAHIDNTGDKNPMKNEETRAKFRGDLNPSKRPEVRQKLKEKCSGKNNAMCGVLSPRYGIAREDMVGNGNPAKSEEARKKISEFAKTRSGELAATFKGWIHTPSGKYPSKKSAASAHNISRHILNQYLSDTMNSSWFFEPKAKI